MRGFGIHAAIDPSIVTLLVVSAGGALGTAARYLVGLGATRWLGTAFPFGTLTVNVVGSFVVAFVLEASLAGVPLSPNARLGLTTGFCGGFTTYSSFNYEVLRSFSQGQAAKASGYLAVTLVLCALAGLAGFVAARFVAPPAGVA